jgi:hypothetical protein
MMKLMTRPAIAYVRGRLMKIPTILTMRAIGAEQTVRNPNRAPIGEPQPGLSMMFAAIEKNGTRESQNPILPVFIGVPISLPPGSGNLP